MTLSSNVYIAVEGIDGTGKSHVSEAIAREFGMKLLKEPSNNEIGELIKKRAWDSRTDFFLFFADRVEQLKDANGNIISDRSLYSTFAYQGVELSNIFGGIDNFYLFFKGLTKLLPRLPDYVILLDGDPELAIQRIKKEREFTRFERLDYLRKVRDNFIYLSSKEKNFTVINADIKLDELIKKSKEIVRGLLQQDRLP